MEPFDLEQVWQLGKSSQPETAGVEKTATLATGLSRNIVERIRQTAVKEQQVFLLLVFIALPVLLFFGYWPWAVGLAVFTALISWKYRVEMRMLDRIEVQTDTRTYLTSVRNLLHYFMRLYRKGILLLTPILILCGMAFSLYLRGADLWATVQSLWFWGVLVLAIVVTIVALQFWLYLWTHSLYGKKLKELDQLIKDLND